MKYIYLLTICLVCISSCTKNSLKSEPITFNDFIGKYTLEQSSAKQQLILNKDSTFEYSISENNVYYIVLEKGKWKLHRITDYNIIVLYDSLYLQKEIQSFDFVDGAHFFYGCNYWRGIRLGQSRAIDPDGAPTRPWWKKQGN